MTYREKQRDRNIERTNVNTTERETDRQIEEHTET